MRAKSKNRSLVSHECLLTLLRYDPDSGKFYWLISPKYNIPVGSQAGGYLNNGYRFIKINSQFYTEHKLAFFYMTGQWPDAEIDHINGYRDDNRWSNLRAAHGANNGLNRKTYVTNTSGAKGVTWHPRLQKWRVRIQKFGKRVALGCYDTLEEAREVYERAAKQYFGDYARDLSDTRREL